MFGDLCFGHESPWQRMFDSRERSGVRCYVLFWGVDTVYNTFKHFAEYRLVERLLLRVEDAEKREALVRELQHKPATEPPAGVEQIWPYYTARLLEPLLFEAGIARATALGEGRVILCDVFEAMSFAEEILRTAPERIVESEAALDWIARARAAGGENSLGKGDLIWQN